MQIHGSPTQQHHRETYGADFRYDGFIPMFDESAAAADLDAIATLCRDAGAGYVVLTTKHHEGFPLWPTAIPHPSKAGYRAQRDLVGDMTDAVRRQGLRMGVYYSGGYDWSFNNAVIRQAADTTLAVPTTEQYQSYATAHVRELIDRYQPSVLWNDIAWPPVATSRGSSPTTTTWFRTGSSTTDGCSLTVIADPSVMQWRDPSVASSS